MKKICFFTILIILIISGCKKSSSNSKTTSPTPPSTTSTFYALPTGLDSALVGDWALDTMQVYINGNYITSSYYVDPINCHLHLTTTEQLAGAPALWKASIHALDCNNISSWWRTTSGRLDLSGNLYTVITITTTKLVILYGTTVGSGNGTKYFLHK